MPESARSANRFDHRLREHGLGPLHAVELSTLQVNLGKLCNQACRHCHVDAGPHQTAPSVNMGPAVVDRILAVLRQGRIACVDITGGAPELNPHFRELVREARALGLRVIDRCNLSVLFADDQADLAGFLAAQAVEITASLPFYHRGPTDRQRGAGVFEVSIRGLRLLNEHGYGRDPRRCLNLVYNPAGAFLPGDQAALEADFKRELDRQFGIRFDRLYCITNMPIRRFLDWLERSGNRARYEQALLDAFNPAAVPGVMCRSLVSVGPDGVLYDCDFNQMLGLPTDRSAPRHVADFDQDALATRRIVTGDHCLGCTAGAGSSCGGALTE
jgi:radical SAM/Cys-rich protein